MIITDNKPHRLTIKDTTLGTKVEIQGRNITFYLCTQATCAVCPAWLIAIIKAQPDYAPHQPPFGWFDVEVADSYGNADTVRIHDDGMLFFRDFHFNFGLGIVYAIKYHIHGGIQLPLLA